MRTCPVCQSENWEDFYQSDTGKIMTGDQRIGSGTLQKIICSGCGVVANKNPFTDNELEVLYGEEYELNTYGREEHLFYTPNGPVPRSQVFTDWIAPHVLPDSKRVTEIGCGEGLFLQKMKNKLPGKTFIGYDGSKKAAALAQKKGLQVEHKLFLSDKDKVSETDVIILINVIEHIENINGLIQSLKKSLSSKGRIIFTLPIQEFGGYDLFFAEHVWHFTTTHFKKILQNNGLNLLYNDSGHPINHGIGLFVCDNNNLSFSNEEINERHVQEKTRDYWSKCFEDINLQIKKNNYKNVAVFGSGEVFTLFSAFSKFGSLNIVACIDQTPSKIGTFKHGVPIYDIDWLKDNKIDALFLATNKKYFSVINEKLKPYNIKNIISLSQ